MARAQILVAEDARLVAEDLRTSLTSLGYMVLGVVASGEEVLQHAAQTPPDLVLMDIGLAGEMDGVETAAHLRAHFDIPVVYLTAYADGATVERATRASPYGYLLKPFSDQDLHALSRRRWISTRGTSAAQSASSVAADACRTGTPSGGAHSRSATP